jgi:hypothetical protein
MCLAYIRDHRRDLYKDLLQTGTLHETILQLQHDIRIRMNAIEGELRAKYPAPATEDTMELYQYNRWISDKTWEVLDWEENPILLPRNDII